MSAVTATTPALPSRNPFIEGANYGIATAAAKNEMLRDIILQIDANTDQLKELTGVLDTWKMSDDWNPFVARQRSTLLEKYGISHPYDTAGITDAVYWAGGNIPVQLPNVNMKYPPIAYAGTINDFNADPNVDLDTTYQLSDGRGAVRWTSFIDGSTKSYLVDLDTVPKYLLRAPTQTEFDGWMSDIQQVAQGKTQIAQTQQAYIQQIIADKSNAELFATGVLQRLNSLFDTIISKIG